MTVGDIKKSNAAIPTRISSGMRHWYGVGGGSQIFIDHTEAPGKPEEWSESMSGAPVVHQKPSQRLLTGSGPLGASSAVGQRTERDDTVLGRAAFVSACPCKVIMYLGYSFSTSSGSNTITCEFQAPQGGIQSLVQMPCDYSLSGDASLAELGFPIELPRFTESTWGDSVYRQFRTYRLLRRFGGVPQVEGDISTYVSDTGTSLPTLPAGSTESIDGDPIPYMPALSSWTVDLEIVEVSAGVPGVYPEDFYTEEV